MVVNPAVLELLSSEGAVLLIWGGGVANGQAGCTLLGAWFLRWFSQAPSPPGRIGNNMGLTHQHPRSPAQPLPSTLCAFIRRQCTHWVGASGLGGMLDIKAPWVHSRPALLCSFHHLILLLSQTPCCPFLKRASALETAVRGEGDEFVIREAAKMARCVRGLGGDQIVSLKKGAGKKPVCLPICRQLLRLCAINLHS